MDSVIETGSGRRCKFRAIYNCVSKAINLSPGNSYRTCNVPRGSAGLPGVKTNLIVEGYSLFSFFK